MRRSLVDCRTARQAWPSRDPEVRLSSRIGTKHIVIAAGALVVLVAGAELMSRAHPSFTAGEADRAFARAVLEPDTATGIRVRPDASITLDGIEYAFSELGTRGELPAEEHAGSVVLVVTDSYGLGWKDEAHRPWPMRIQRRGEALGHRVRVVNAAVPGANIESHVARVEQLVEAVKPAVVVVGHSPDDAAEVARVPGAFGLALPSVVGELFASAPRHSAEWFTALHSDDGEGMKRVESAYAKLGNLCRAKELKCVIAALSPSIADAAAFAPVKERFQSIAERAGLPILDATGTLQEDPASWAIAAGDPRPGEEAHDRIGATIAIWLVEENLLPRAPPRTAAGETVPAPSDSTVEPVIDPTAEVSVD